MFSILNNLLPDHFNQRTHYQLNHHRIKYGVNANIDFSVSDDLGNYKGNRPGAFIGNEVSLFGDFASYIADDVPIYDGMRSDVITPDGEFSIDLAEQALLKSTNDKLTTGKQILYLGYNGGMRNCVSMLYNLLRMYAIEEHGEVIYDPNAIFYDNGHVQIKNYQMFKDKRIKSTMRGSVEYAPAMLMEPDLSWRDDYGPTDPSIIWSGRLDNKSGTILSRAAGAFVNRAPFGVSHDSQELCQRLVVFATAGSSHIEDVSYAAKDVLYVLNKVVTDNNLYTDFMYAYLMYLQVLVSPVPRSAEAAAWFVNAQVVTMPRFVTDTGYIPQLYQGKLYSRYKNWKETYMNFKSYPRTALFHSIVLVEAAYVELNNISRIDDFDAINRTNFTSVSIEGQPITNGGILTDLTLLSMRYSKELSLPYPVSTGLTRTNILSYETEIEMNIIIKDVNAPKYYAIKQHDVTVGSEATLVVTNFTAPLYPVMSYGINADEYYANGLELDITFDAPARAKGITFKEVEPFSKFMNVMRMAGFNVTANEMMSQKTVINWADNASGRFLYTDAQVDDDVFYHIPYENIVRRQNSWINSLTLRGHVNFKAKINAMNFKLFNGGNDVLITGRLVKPIEPTDFSQVALEIASRTDVIKIKPLKRVFMQDFRRVRYQFPTMLGTASTLLQQGNVQAFGLDENEPVNPISEDISIRDIE